ncbi:hypothetical protein D3C71_1771890 [compost metagenome]
MSENTRPATETLTTTGTKNNTRYKDFSLPARSIASAYTNPSAADSGTVNAMYSSVLLITFQNNGLPSTSL